MATMAVVEAQAALVVVVVAAVAAVAAVALVVNCQSKFDNSLSSPNSKAERARMK